jgi:hypothetical protein
MWHTLQQWILQRSCCRAFKIAVPWPAMLLAFFSTSDIPYIIGLKLMWECKINILSIYSNLNNSCYCLSLEEQMDTLL